MGYQRTMVSVTSYHVSSSQRIERIYVLIDLLASIRKTYTLTDLRANARKADVKINLLANVKKKDAKQARKLKKFIFDIEKKNRRKDLNLSSMRIRFEEDSDSYTVCWNHGIFHIEIAEYAKIELIIFAPNTHKPFDHKDNCNFFTLALSKLFVLERANKLDTFKVRGKLCGDKIWIYLDLKFLGNHSIMSSFSQLNKIELFGLYHYIKNYLFTDGVVEYCEIQRKFPTHKEYIYHEKEFLHSIESELPMDEVNRRIKLVENKKSLFSRWGDIF